MSHITSGSKDCRRETVTFLALRENRRKEVLLLLISVVCLLPTPLPGRTFCVTEPRGPPTWSSWSGPAGGRARGRRGSRKDVPPELRSPVHSPTGQECGLWCVSELYVEGQSHPLTGLTGLITLWGCKGDNRLYAVKRNQKGVGEIDISIKHWLLP